MNLRDNRSRAQNTRTLIWLSIGISGVCLISEINQYVLLNGEYTLEEVEFTDNMQLISGLLYTIIRIIAGVLFIMWFRRAYWNLHQIGTMKPEHSEGWAAGAWFVPILNWFRPYHIMMEIKRGYRKLSGNETNLQPNVVYSLWWSFWVISGVAASISTQVANFTTTMTGFQNALLFGALASIASVVSGILVILIINEISENELKIAHGISNENITQHLISDEEHGFN